MIVSAIGGVHGSAYAEPMTTPEPKNAPRRGARNPRTEIIYAVAALVFSLIAWVINPWFVPSLIGIVLSIRALLIGRRMLEAPRKTVLVLGTIGLIVGILAAIGTVLALVVRVP